MRIVCLIAVLCSFGCTRSDHSQATGTPEQQDHAKPEQQDHDPVTLEDLVYAPAGFSAETPIVCGADHLDFPEGRELVFRHTESEELTQAVFPEGATAPKDLNGEFVLHGHYQGIQNLDRFKFKRHKRVPSDYRYFVVATWERKK